MNGSKALGKLSSMREALDFAKQVNSIYSRLRLRMHALAEAKDGDSLVESNNKRRLREALSACSADLDIKTSKRPGHEQSLPPGAILVLDMEAELLLVFSRWAVIEALWDVVGPYNHGNFLNNDDLRWMHDAFEFDDSE